MERTHGADVKRALGSIAPPARGLLLLEGRALLELAALIPAATRRPLPRQEAMRAQLSTPLPVPSTAIYSRSDAIVAWQSCREEEGPLSENIEVASSHLGIGHHPVVLLTIADRLAQPEGAWRPFSHRRWR